MGFDAAENLPAVPRIVNFGGFDAIASDGGCEEIGLRTAAAFVVVVGVTKAAGFC